MAWTDPPVEGTRGRISGARLLHYVDFCARGLPLGRRAVVHQVEILPQQRPERRLFSRYYSRLRPM